MDNMKLFSRKLLKNASRYIILPAISVICFIIGFTKIEIVGYIGLAVLVLYIVLCLGPAIQLFVIADKLSEDDPKYIEMKKLLRDEPRNILEGTTDVLDFEKDTKEELHGEKLLKLSDHALLAHIFSKHISKEYASLEEISFFETLDKANKTAYVLLIFLHEFNHGGLCQFFVNSSKRVAPYLNDAMLEVGATDHSALFCEFVQSNNIDVNELSSFEVSNNIAYRKQIKRFDYDTFDVKFVELPELEIRLLRYIKININEF